MQTIHLNVYITWDKRRATGHIVRNDGKRVCKCDIPRDHPIHELEPYPNNRWELCRDSGVFVKTELQRLQRWTPG